MATPYDTMRPGLNGFSNKPFAVTPHDSTDFTNTSRYFYVGTAGNVVLVREDGTAVTYTNVQAGSYILAAGKRINSTNTTASNIVGHE